MTVSVVVDMGALVEVLFIAAERAIKFKFT